MRREQAVEGQALGPGEGGQGAAHQAQPGLELEGAVLAVAEADGEPGIGVVLGGDVGDAEAVAGNGHLPAHPAHPQGPVDCGQALAQCPHCQPGPVHHAGILSGVGDPGQGDGVSWAAALL